ncbi:hypothetical protein FIV31_01655 [Coxiella endosymbiont of Ornithodoros amblus]|nr:hypothetical protein [Coxiella endosymbiont of Ornithodoros amblus]
MWQNYRRNGYPQMIGFSNVIFRHDPLKPGYLEIDAIWQLLGLYISLRAGVGSGRALVQKSRFFG